MKIEEIQEPSSGSIPEERWFSWLALAPLSHFNS